MYLNVTQVAGKLHLSKESVVRLIKTGDLPAKNIGKRNREFWRVDSAALRTWRAAHNNGHGPKEPAQDVAPSGVPDGYVSVYEAAKSHNMTHYAIRGRMEKGEVKFVQVGRRYYVDPATVEPRKIAPKGQRWAKVKEAAMRDSLQSRISLPMPARLLVPPPSPTPFAAFNAVASDVSQLKAAVSSIQLHLNELTVLIQATREDAAALKKAWGI